MFESTEMEENGRPRIMHGSRAKRFLAYHELNETSTSFVGFFVRKEDEGLFTLTSKEMPHLKNT